MDITIFFKGILCGLLVTIPIGPMGILCVQRTLHYGRWSGHVSSLGAILGDAIHASLAVFGLTFVSNFLTTAHFWLRLVGGIILLYLGVKTFAAKVSEVMKVSHTNLVNDFISAFFLMMTNPMTIFGFIVLFASFGLSKIEEDYWNSFTLVVGVVTGASLGWFSLCEIVALSRKKINSNVMRWINRVAGIVFLGFGFAALISLVL